MEQISRCREEDIPALAKLHLKIYGVLDNESIDSLELHYRRVLFDSPWYDEEIPSLVFRSGDGDVEGLLGVMVRRMVYKGKPIRVAVVHGMMVDPDCSSPMAIILLMKKVLSGPQDLIISDRSSVVSTPFWKTLGAGVSHLHSMHWLCLLSPLRHYGNVLGKKRGLIRLLGWALDFASVFPDFFVRILWRRYIQSRQMENGRVLEVDCRTLLLSMNKNFQRTPLHPEYMEPDLQWMAEFFDGKTNYGKPQGFEVLNEKDQRVGSCIYCLGDVKGMDILFLWTREDAADFVFNQLLKYALNLGATNIGGRMDPRFLKSMSGYPCRIRQRDYWFVVHSRDPEILNAIHRGDAILSEFDEQFVVTLG